MTDQVKEDANASAPTCSVGGGQIAGIGIGLQGEPGVTKKNRKKIVLQTFRRWLDINNK